MNRRILGLVGALLLAAIGTAMIVGYVHGADARALDGQKTVRVLVVKRWDHQFDDILPYVQYLRACKQLLVRRKQLISDSRVSLARSSAT